MLRFKITDVREVIIMPKGRAANQAVKLMIIRDYLLSHTNETHYVTSKDIIAHLESHGIRADRKTIFTDIDRLEFDYGMPIERGGRKGYRVASPQFEPRELRLMIDSVQSAKFITDEEAATLTSKIKDLSDIYTRPTLERKAYVSERIQDKGESVVSYTDKIHEAISLDAQISFKYAHHHPTLGKNNKRYSNNGAPYIVSPFALYWNNGNYYLYAYLSDKDQFRFFRIDRMESIKILSAKREGHEKFSDATLKGQRKAKVFDMYKGEVSNVTLRAVNSIADQVVDAFGRSVMLIPDGKENFTVNVLVDVSPTFFAWLTNFGSKIEIVGPPQIREQFKEHISELSNLYK